MQLVVLLFIVFLIGGCATYALPSIDEKTGRYSEAAPLEEGAIEKNVTDVDLEKYRFVYLNAESNVHSSRFEFFVREALVRFGFNHILNQTELLDLVTSTEEASEISSISDPLAQRKLSDIIGPILYVEFLSRWDGNASRYVNVQVVDVSTGKVLLKINHPKMIMMEVDSEVHYPVLNAIKDWVEICKQNGVEV